MHFSDAHWPFQSACCPFSWLINESTVDSNKQQEPTCSLRTAWTSSANCSLTYNVNKSLRVKEKQFNMPYEKELWYKTHAKMQFSWSGKVWKLEQSECVRNCWTFSKTEGNLWGRKNWPSQGSLPFERRSYYTKSLVSYNTKHFYRLTRNMCCTS